MNLAIPLLLEGQALELSRPEDMSITTRTVAGKPILIVDGLYRRPEQVRALALGLAYRHAIGAYPGAFAAISLENEHLLAFLREQVRRLEMPDLEYTPFYRDVWFATVTRPAEELEPGQRQPHFDPFCDWASVVYLNLPGQCSGGTSFWRHRGTGLTGESLVLTAEQEALASRHGFTTVRELVRWCLAEGHASAGEGYLQATNEQWELLELVEMRFNRLVFYDSKLFHNIHYDPTRFGPSIHECRLTQNLYFNTRRD